MPSKRKKSEGTTSVPELKVPAEFLDQLVKGPMTQAEVEAVCRSLKKAILERALGAELTHHLGYSKGEDKPEGEDNHRNGSTSKTVLTDDGALPIAVPRDRAGTFEPQIIAKGERRFTGFDDKIIAMYARGMSVREIQGYLEEIYGVEVSPDFISTVTDAVVEEVREWQVRPLEALYPVIFFDALRVKIRDEGTVKNKAVYLALAILPDGTKDILGIWIEQTEGAKFWLKVMTELKNRGVNDVLIAVVDGLKGFPEAIAAVFPRTQIQTCIVHLIRASLDYASWKDRKSLAAELRTIYRASDAEAAASRAGCLRCRALGPEIPDRSRPAGAGTGKQVIPFFAYPAEVRKIIYTTNAIESLHMQLRKIIKTRGHFPSDEAATKLLWLALRNILAGKGKINPGVEGGHESVCRDVR